MALPQNTQKMKLTLTSEDGSQNWAQESSSVTTIGGLVPR